MLPLALKHLEQQVGCSIDYVGLLGKLFRAVDKAQKLDYAVHAIKITESFAYSSKQIKRDLSRCFISLFFAHIWGLSPPEAMPFQQQWSGVCGLSPCLRMVLAICFKCAILPG